MVAVETKTPLAPLSDVLAAEEPDSHHHSPVAAVAEVLGTPAAAVLDTPAAAVRGIPAVVAAHTRWRDTPAAAVVQDRLQERDKRPRVEDIHQCSGSGARTQPVLGNRAWTAADSPTHTAQVRRGVRVLALGELGSQASMAPLKGRVVAALLESDRADSDARERRPSVPIERRSSSSARTAASPR